MLFLDVETFFDAAELYTLRKMPMVQYCADSRRQLHCMGVFNQETFEPQVLWSEDPVYEYLKAHMPCTIVGQNTVFDALYLKNLFPDLPWRDCQFMCTLSMAQHLYHQPGSLSLDALGMSLVGAQKSHDVLRFDGMSTDQILSNPEAKRDMHSYVLHDVHLCMRLFKRMLPEIPHCHLRTINWAVHTFVNPRLGLHQDRVAVTKRKLEVARIDMVNKVGTTPDVLSSRQKFAQLVVDRGFAMPTKISPTTKKPIPQLAKDDDFITMNVERKGELGDLVRGRVAFSSSLELSRATKWLDYSYMHGEDTVAPYHFHVMPSGTFTHRLAGRGGMGDNPLNQNRGSELRKAVVPLSSSDQLIGFDFSSLELRIARWVAKDLTAINTILAGGDIYRTFIAHVLKVVAETIGKDDPRRQTGKTCQLSLQYGVGWKTLRKRLYASGIDITEDEARELVHAFRNELHTALPDAWNVVERRFMLQRHGGLENFLNLPGHAHEEGWQWPSGRILRYRNLRQRQWKNPDNGRMEWRWSWQPSYTGYNKYTYASAVFQSFIQSLANEFICESRDRLREAGYHVALECYDELLIVVPKAWDVEEAKQDIVELVTEPVDWWADPPPMGIDIAHGDSYGQCH